VRCCEAVVGQLLSSVLVTPLSMTRIAACPTPTFADGMSGDQRTQIHNANGVRQFVLLLFDVR
jgi:hypothetical protein